MRPGPILAVGVAVAAAAGLVLAQGPARQIPHEDLPPPSDKPTPMIGDTGSGRNPTAFAAGDKVLPKPALEAPKDKPPPKTEPVLGKGGFAADRQTDMRPDENTGPDATLHYVSVFNPDVLPFKRMTSFDAVGDDENLHVSRTVLTEIPVGGTTDFHTRDRFWGDVLVDLRPGVDVPLPSVAPDMRILSYEIKPRIALKFSKDGADNFYVKSDENSASGTYRLVFLADADAGYFAPQLPARRMKVSAVARATPPELRPVVPARVLQSARVTLRKLGIDDPDLDLNFAFNKLVGHFRAFTAKPITSSSGDIYRDLCDQQAGVCRHRSFAFMITANALGIPTRYVENEAHAFVEVWFPERGWQRIDLGGAALRMEVSGADNKTLHRPRSEDPFTKPTEYKQSYTQLEGEIHGLSSQQLADKHKSLDQSPASGSLGSGAGSGGPEPDRITPNPLAPSVVIDPKKPSPELRITSADASAFRGDLIHVEGIVRVGTKGVPDHPITVYLAYPGDHAHNTFLGNAVTDATGEFRGDFPMPRDLDLRAYDIVLTSGEDPYYNAAISN